MPASVTLISPGRGRHLDAVDIIGTGFAAANNAVTFDGFPAAILVQGSELVRVTVPGALAGTNRHAVVVVTNLDDASESTWWWWAKDTIAVTETTRVPVKTPGASEVARGLGTNIKNMTTAEARFFERIASKIELVHSALSAKGDFFSKAATGLRRAPAGGIVGPHNDVFVSAVGALGGKFKPRICQTLSWGLELNGTTLTAFMQQGATDGAIVQANSYEAVMAAGSLALVSIRERLSPTSRVNQVEIFVDDVLVHTEEFLPGIKIASFTFYPGVEVAAGARVQVRVRRNNVTTDCQCLCYGVVT